MATIDVYPREGTTYPDAAGVPITAAGATVEESTYIDRALRKHHLFNWDPLGIYLPEDRTGSGTGGGDGLAFDTAALLGAFVGTVGGQVATTTGCSSRGDGGGGQWYWDNGSSTTANTGIVLGAGGGGRWKRIYSGPIHSRWFGAKGDGTTDDTAALQAFIDAIPAGGAGYWDPGTYKVTSSLFIDNDEVQISAAPSSLVGNGVKVVWAGASSSVYAIYLSGYAQNLSGISVAATSSLYGGFHVGHYTGHTNVINSRCQLKDCSVLAGAGVSDTTIQFGFGVATVDTVSGNQDFNYFENCIAQNMEQAGMWIGGTPNCIQTTLRRCAFINSMGNPGSKKYVARGMSDGELHPYGIGIRIDQANGVDIDGVNFGYLETAFKRSDPSGTATDAVNYDRISNIDSEHVKKLFYYRVTGPLGTLSVNGGRVSTFYLDSRSLGPDGPGGTGYLDTDTEFCYFDGPVVSLNNVGMQVGDNSVKFDKCIAVDRGTLTAIGCTFPSVKPFKGSTVAKIVSWGNYGPNGGSPSDTFSKVLDGSYRVQAGGYLDPVHIDALQGYHTINMNAANTVTPTAPDGASGSDPDYYRSAPGTVTITGTDTTGTATLSVGELNSNYSVALTPVSFTGSPAAGSMSAVARNKTNGTFDATVPVAPGAGASVTFRYIITNDIP